MIPHIYLRRDSDDEETSEAHSDACRNWLATNGYTAPRIWSDFIGEGRDMRKNLLSSVVAGNVQVLVFWSVGHMADTLRETGDLIRSFIEAGVSLVFVQEDMDLRGRDAVSVGKRDALLALVSLVDAEKPPSNAGRNPIPYSDDQLALVAAHYAKHARRRPRELATLMGITPGQASTLLARDHDKALKLAAAEEVKG